jgi:hypothetical protein
MKKRIIFLSVFLCLLFISCQEKVDPAAEEEAIKEVIITETNSFWSQDLVKLLDQLVQDEHLVYISIGTDGYKERLGYDKVYSYYKKASTQDWSAWTDRVVERTNWKIDIFGDNALVLYNQKESVKLDGEVIETQSKELRLMKKVKGHWKISMIQWIDLSSFIDEEVAGKEF